MVDDLKKSLETVATGGSFLFFGTIISVLLAMINSILLARILGVENYGIFSLASTIILAICPFTTYGLFGSLPRFLPFHYARGEKDIVKSAINSSIWLVSITSTIFFIVLYFFSEQLSTVIYHEPGLNTILKYFAIAIPIIGLYNIFEAIVRSFKAIKFKVVAYDLLFWIIRIIIFIPFIVIGYSLIGAILSYLISMTFIIIVSIFVLRKKIFSDQSKYHTVPVTKKLLTFSWPLACAAIISLFLTRTDVLLLGYYYTSTDVGIYSVALTIAAYVTLLASPFSYIFLPVVSELFGKLKLNEVESIFKSASKWIVLLVVPVYIYILLYSREIINLLYGTDYSGGSLALMILATGISMNVFTGMTGGILVGGGYTRLNLVVEIIAALTNVILNIILIPKFGILGASIGTATSYFTRNIASLYLVYNKTKMHIYNKKYFNIILSGLSVLIICYLLKLYILPYVNLPFIPIFAGFILIALFVLFVIVFKCLDRNDRYIVKIILKKTKLDQINFLNFDKH